jgi:uncharacterized protein YjbJ (UPF0337 family)
MGKLNEVTQKIGGKSDQLVGEAQEDIGVKGGTTKKIKGKLKEVTAPLRNVDDDDPDYNDHW